LRESDALVKVATFSAFARDDDPYGEHDFGFFELVNRTFYWKIDYYDEKCEFGSSQENHARAHANARGGVLRRDVP
jgi:Protein of unknown function (DUF3768)